MRILSRELARVLIVCCVELVIPSGVSVSSFLSVELVCMISWPSFVVQKMMRTLSKKKQENVHSML